MKKLILLCCALQCIFLTACRHHHGDTSIRYKDTYNSYSMDAWFSKKKTRRAERYLDEMIGRNNNISFYKTHTDALFTLDDGSKFYMKKSPGHILIRINKDETSAEAYHTMKEMCKGMKEVIVE